MWSASLTNLFPAEVAQLVSLFLEGNAAEARQIHEKFFALFKDLFIEPNPVPVKTVLAWRGAMTAECRLPLVGMNAANETRLRKTWESWNACFDEQCPARAARRRPWPDGPGGRSGGRERAGLTIKAELERGDPITPGINDCDVVIDFSSADATEAVCRACAEHRKALVLGTTGHNATQKTSIAAAARQIPIVFAANFSVGVNALFALTRRAAELLGAEFDVDVIEMHHRTKKDAPSGTAKRLVEILTGVGEANRPLTTHSFGPATSWATTWSSLPDRESGLELIHRATSRETFAAGALRAARWIIDQPAGLYSMENVLGF